MRIKAADDKSKRLTLLEELQASSMLDTKQKGWLSDEVMRLKKGVEGETAAAYYLDTYFKDSQNNVVIHDVRFVVDGEVAQIDHLIINRAHSMYLLETKNYACNLSISAHGEFTADYGNKQFGIESPIEQSLRHERVLCRLLEQLGIVGRTQKLPTFQHVVMLHPKAIITRPVAKDFETSNVIKADQFPTWHTKHVDKTGFGSAINSILNLRSPETIKEWGEKLVRQHRPADLLSLPDFMKPRRPVKAIVTAPIAATEASKTISLPLPQPQAVQAPAVNLQTPLTSAASPGAETPKRLICAHCQAKISYPEGKFCWNNARRFGGLAYCREHQGLIVAI